MMKNIEGSPQKDAIDPKTAPLHTLMIDEFFNEERRITQIMDWETDRKRREWYEELHGPLVPMTVERLWQELGRKGEFKKRNWEYFTRFSGTADMYADPEHQRCIHGDDHLGRVQIYAYILGQYKGVTEDEMTVLLIAASVHDRARRDDRVAPNHGIEAAENFVNTKTYTLRNGTRHTVKPYINTYLFERGMLFRQEQIDQIKLLCEYHEKPWEEVPEDLDPRTRLLIQVMQAADAADRFRAPSIEWWPQEKYFDEIFREPNGLINAQAQEAFLQFAAYFTLSSEQERFGKYRSDPHGNVQRVIRQKAVEIGIVENTVLPYFGWSRRRINSPLM